jgi:hypothetical protein
MVAADFDSLAYVRALSDAALFVLRHDPAGFRAPACMVPQSNRLRGKARAAAHLSGV